MKKRITYFINRWYYFKIPFILGLALLILLTLFVRDLLAPKDTALSVGIVTTDYYSDEQLASLSTALSARYGPTKVNVYHIALGETGQDMTQISLLDGDLIAAKSFAFLVQDPQAFLDAVNGPEFSQAVQLQTISDLSGLGFDALWLMIRS